MESFQKNVIDEALGNVITEVQGKQKKLHEQIAQAESEKDTDKLRDIANKEVPRIIDETRCVLQQLQRKIDEAQREFEDKELGVDAANFEHSAAKFKVQAAKATLEGDALAILNALNYQKAAQTRIERDTALLEEKDRLLSVRKSRAEIARLMLRHAKDECIDYGIDPEAKETQKVMHGYFADKQGLSLIGALFRSKDAESPHQRSLLREMANEFVGILQWVHLLRLETPGTDPSNAAEWYRKLLQELAKDTTLREKANNLNTWTNKVEGQFQKQQG